MKSSLKIGFALAGVLFAGHVAAADPAAPPMFGQSAKPLPRVEKGFKRILNGKDTNGWQMAGPGKFVLMPDGSIGATGGMGMLWYNKEQLKNFVLRADWKAEKPSSNSGIFVRFPDPGNDPWVAVNKGYEIQIADSYDPLHRTGSVYTFAEAKPALTKPNGEWNTMEITAVGKHYTIKVNGVTTSEYDGDRSTEGFVGLQNHSDGDKVWFRNVRVKKL